MSGSPSDDDEDYSADSDDDVVATISCPYCRRPIYEEAVACEHCGRYLSELDHPWRRPWWLIVGVVAGLLCVWFWLKR